MTESTIGTMPTMMDVRRQMANHGKTPVPASVRDLAVTVLVLFPVWAMVLLPLTLGYQIVNKVLSMVLPAEEFQPISPFDSGYKVNKEDIIPRSKRKYDIVVMGATGFAGKLAVRYLAKSYGVNKEIKWAIAGRSQQKLDEVKSSLAADLGLESIKDVDTIIADTSVPSTMPNLVRDTKALVSTTGPFWNYGSSVVEFCSKFGTHYADITGEADWVRAVMGRWQDTARETGAMILPLAGHDSIPWELSFSLLAQQLKEATGEDLIECNCYDESKLAPSGGTVATILLAFGGNPPSPPAHNPFQFTSDGKPNPFRTTSGIKLYPSVIKTPWNDQPSYGSPFLMSSINIEAIEWSRALRGGGPLKYSEVQVNPDLKTAIVEFFGLVLFFTGILNPVSKFLMSNFSLPKPGEGPSMEDMEHNSFLTVTTKVRGSRGSEGEAVMYFPRDAGYLDTARMLVETGLLMAREEGRLPVKTGGFFTPGFALGPALLHRLTNTGTFFHSQIKTTGQCTSR